MTSVIASLFADKILRAAERLVGALDGLSEEAALAAPREGANTVAGIVNHALANLQDNVLSVVGGAWIARDRASEFVPDGGSPAIIERWTLLRPRIAAVLDQLDDDALYGLARHGRRGEITVAEVLMVVLRHLGEHEGEALLTRGLVSAPGHSGT